MEATKEAKEMTETTETKNTAEAKSAKPEKPAKPVKERKGLSAKSQMVGATLLLTVVLLVELYLMINYQSLYIVIIVLAFVALGGVYALVNAVMACSAEKEAKRQDHLEDIIRSEKASYILVKSKFEEMEAKLAVLQASAKIPSEEIINAQKGIAKVIITRSKENADAIINSNDQVLERLDEMIEAQNSKFTGISKDQRLKLTEMSNQTELKLQDMLLQLKDMEIRLNQAIMQTGGKVVVAAEPVFEEPITEVFIEKSGFEESTLEELTDEEVLEELMEQAVVEEIIRDIAEDGVLDEFVIEGPAEEGVVEALLEDIMEDGVLDNFVLEEVVVEEPVIEVPVVEEAAAPEIDLSDPNKVMSPDDIAALFASMAGGAAEEPVEEEPAEEEIPPMPDLSDPNKQLSPDEIAALIANL